MMERILTYINWVDILMGCICIRCLYVGAKNGLVVSLFKLFAVISAAWITLHYYVQFAKLLHKLILIPQGAGEPLAFVLLWFGVVVLFKIVRDGYMLVARPGLNAILDKWTGFTLAFPRAAVFCSLMFFLLFISGNQYLMDKARTSATGVYLTGLSLNIYRVGYAGVVRKFFHGEKRNDKAFTVLKKNKKAK